MEKRPDPPEPEELSFGEVSERTARLHAWILARRRALAVCAAATLLICAAAAGGWYLRDLSRRPLPPPDGPWPERYEIMAGLCSPLISDCGSGGDAAAKDPAAVRAAVQAATGAAAVRLVDPAGERPGKTVWTSRVLAGTHYAPSSDTVYLPVLVARLDRREDYARAVEQAGSVPGVSHVVPGTPDFWTGKADVEIRFCANGPDRLCTGVRDRSITEAQKRDIVDRLWAIEGVEKIYFEDRAHADKVAAHYAVNGTRFGDDRLLSLRSLEEAFYVRLTDRRAVKTIGETVKDMPGVHVVRALGPA
ncbi:hypothetical protein Ssi03_43060 [Sphaerisporangium siamense]|uniref:FtsX extracellular domain-containing protein n=1 Tax=Sphaerisporangium siamense TaxID=795645 RepID=A0A7W7DDM9_9ACTN|nr:permease-like cell division protein FtsX [Sphaerisporangium siamense]MBB4704701.1 hypothetical protein [Sphaerisporangium siamense]GII86316.1 hypothetical protein Ssi03_43060 [Sphaerisporangium siamense]